MDPRRPTIFPDNQAQSDFGEYSSINETYRKCGFRKLTPYNGIRTDTTFVEWMLSDFWGGLINGERPRLFIVPQSERQAGACSVCLRLPKPHLGTETCAQSRTHVAPIAQQEPIGIDRR